MRRYLETSTSGNFDAARPLIADDFKLSGPMIRLRCSLPFWTKRPAHSLPSGPQAAATVSRRQRSLLGQRAAAEEPGGLGISPNSRTKSPRRRAGQVISPLLRHSVVREVDDPRSRVRLISWSGNPRYSEASASDARFRYDGSFLSVRASPATHSWRRPRHIQHLGAGLPW